MFPSFIMIWSTIKKVSTELEKVMTISSRLPTETWFTRALEIVIAQLLIINIRHLQLPRTKNVTLRTQN